MSLFPLTALPTYLNNDPYEQPKKFLKPKALQPPPQENREPSEYTSAKELNDILESIK